MKYAVVVVVVVVGAVVGVSAQQSYQTIYEYYSDCASTTTGPVSTASGTQTYSLPTGVTYNPSNVTGYTTQVTTICPTCTAAAAPQGKSVLLTTYATVYSCPGPSGLQAKTYTVTEPCSTPGVPRSSGYIPQGFTTTTVQCTACPGSPYVLITTPIAQQTSPPGIPGGGSSSPGAPGGGSSSPGVPGGGSSPPGGGSSSPGGGSSSPPSSPGGGSSSPGGGSSSPGGGSSSPGGGSSSPGGGSSSPGGGSSSPGGNAAVPPYPNPAASQNRAGSAPSGGSAFASGNANPAAPFPGVATKIATISLSFAAGVAGFVALYFI